MTKQIQKLAEELKEKFNTTFSDISDYEFEQFARHVLERELTARLEEVEEYGDSYLRERNTRERIVELINQLQQLRASK